MNITKVLAILSVSVGICFTASANFVVDQINANRSQFNNELELAKSHLQSNRLDSAMLRLEKAKDLLPTTANESNNTSAYLDYLEVYIDFLIKKHSYKEALQLANEMLSVSTRQNNSFKIAASYYAIALSHRCMGHLQDATTNITEALNIAEKMGYVREQGKYHLFLAGVFFELRDGKKSYYYSRKAYEILTQSGNSDLIKNKVTLPATEMLSGNTELALKHLIQAEKSIDKKREPFEIANILLFKSHVFYQKKQYKHSLNELNKIPIYFNATSKTYPDLPLHVEIAMAQTLCALKNYQKANYYFEKNIAWALKRMDSNDIKECLELGSEIQEGLGNNAKALDYLKQYRVYSDSVNKLSVDKAIHETEVKYQTSVKEKAISEQKLLLANKNNELYKKNRYIFLSVSAIVLLVLMSAIGFLVYRNRNQSINMSLLKAQIHPHFLFNTLNNLYALSIAKSNDAPGVVMGLANILRYVLYECNTAVASLQKEMDIIAEYIVLEKVRYGNRLEVNLLNHNDLSNCKIAPLLLLPLVENAYKHGASKLKQDSWINIETKIKENQFVFKISNNKPTVANSAGSKTEHGNIGLKNIKKRLEILYPKRHTIKITDDDGIFMVVLKVPLA